eukprot:CAMPEP_0206144522 /NCGR_PEP_ID=MMETSP1473-20131121/24362_1 /ASSEMBLY_ACC=CAM_ASM_001109 /TAXON_ID=1461547 /ORGANISM="Stichococcus sp, Strain RCC1054" /LENGTH=356 /DNA_ID=CAMNT_0053540361 /DNA_START=113 /DNA_END=1183 /DNA_ORIENTATION=+
MACRAAVQASPVAKLSDLKVACFSAHKYVLDAQSEILLSTFPKTTFLAATLDVDTAKLAEGCDAVLVFVNDDVSAEVGQALQRNGVRFVGMRCAGFDRVDVQALNDLGIKVARVPTYSPESVAEHSVSLAMALNRNLVKAHIRVLQGNFTLSGLIGRELNRKTVGILGTGAIGTAAARIWKGIGATVLAHDIRPNPELDGVVKYVSKEQLLSQSDFVSLHCPLLPSTFHIIDGDSISSMKEGAMVINCGRGGLVDTAALIDALEDGKLGGAAMDVYENEGNLFFQDFTQYSHKDRSQMKVFDRQFQLLMSFPNVLVTPHTAFLTEEALKAIAETSVQNLTEFATNQPLSNEVKPTK